MHPLLSRAPRGSMCGLIFLVRAMFTLPRLDVVIACTTPTLPIALAARIMRKKAIFYALELAIPGNVGSGRYSYAQYLLRRVDIAVYTTGEERSRVFHRAFRTTRRPGVLPCYALRSAPSVRPDSRSPTIRDLVRAEAKQDIKLLVAVNGGLTSTNCLDIILEAEIAAETGVIIALIGIVDEQWKTRIRAMNQITANYFYLGEVSGSRYDLIRFLRTADLGLVLKRYDRTSSWNDRLYTPNKMHDFLAAGVPVICSDQLTLRGVKRRGIGIVLERLEPVHLRNCLLEICSQRHTTLESMRSRVRASFSSDLNFEEACLPLLSQLTWP
jgi:hypothetical protein